MEDEREPEYSSPVTILVFGILSVTGCACFAGIPAILMGTRTIAAIKNGKYPDKDLGLAQAGLALGYLSFLLFGIAMVLFIVVSNAN